MKLPGAGRRALSYLIDLVLPFLFAAAFFALGYFYFPSGFPLVATFALALLVEPIAYFLLSFLSLSLSRGRTIGLAVCSLSLKKEDGTEAGAREAFMKSAVDALLPVAVCSGLSLFYCHSERTLADKLAGTILVRK